jgi:hypothetical protein
MVTNYDSFTKAIGSKSVDELAAATCPVCGEHFSYDYSVKYHGLSIRCGCRGYMALNGVRPEPWFVAVLGAQHSFA